MDFLIAITLLLSPPDGGYTSCAQAAADGVTDITQGDPGWRPSLDRDRDGVACESTD